MDVFTERRLFAVIAGLDAINNAKTTIEDAEEGERLQEIKQYVFPLLDAEWERLDEELRQIRG